MGRHNLQDIMENADFVGGTEVTLLKIDGTDALIAYGTTVPTDSASGFATGCLFIHTDGGDGTALYVNEGTASSCDFNAITVA